MHYLFVELASINIKVSLNFFCEKHGKNSRDQHFSVVSNFLQQESMIKKLSSSQDICDAIEKRQVLANLNNARISSLQKSSEPRKEFKQVQTRSFVVPIHETSTVIHNHLRVCNLKRFYNFYTDDDSFILKTHYMSDQTEFQIVQATCKNSSGVIKINQKRDRIEPVVFSSKYISQKMLNWRIMQRSKSNIITVSQISSDNRYSDNDQREFSYNHCKSKCTGCLIKCLYRLSEINSKNYNLTQAQIINELHAHGHPKSRLNRITRSNRTLAQAKIELYNHYLSHHFYNQN